MKILHISPYSPVPPIFGGALRIFYMLKGLARRHDVTFVTFGSEEDREILNNEFGKVVRQIHIVDHKPLPQRYPWLGVFYAIWKGQGFLSTHVRSSQMQETIDRILKNEDYDLVLIEFPLMGQYKLPDNVIKVLDEHNVEYSNLERMYQGLQSPARKLLYYREHRKMFHDEIDTCNMVDAIFVTSKKDGDTLGEQINRKPTYIIPNGVDTEYFVPSDETTEPYSMVFTGTMDYIPNRDAMMYFLDEIFPLVKNAIPEAKIYIVGKNPPAALKRRASKDIIVTGYVYDVRPYAWRASVYVVPLRMGSGTRLKILEGLAMKKAIVTTSIGCEGIDVKNGENVMVADEPVLFAEKVVDLLLDEEKARQLGSNGYEMVTSKYDWEIIASSMNEATASIFQKKLGKVSSSKADVSESKSIGNVTPTDRLIEKVNLARSDGNHIEFVERSVTPEGEISPSSFVNVEGPKQASAGTVQTAIQVNNRSVIGESPNHRQSLSRITPPVKVLMYHRIIADKDISNNYLWTVTTSRLRRHLELLDRWGYTCINFEDYSLFRDGKIPLPKKPVMLTFDDGYEEIYRCALPIIKEFGVRAIVFALGDRSIKRNSWDEPGGFEGAALMNSDQLLELDEAGFEIGSHSMTHADLTKLSRDAAWYEIRRSKESLEELLRKPVITFAYPFGSLNKELENMVRDAGYEFGCGTYSGSPRFLHNIYNIRRIAITNKSNSINFGLGILTPHEYYRWLKWDAKQKVQKLLPLGYGDASRKKSTQWGRNADNARKVRTGNSGHQWKKIAFASLLLVVILIFVWLMQG